MRKFFLAIFLFFALGWLFVPAAKAATINAASCSQADVQAAIDAAGDGYTVLIPEGTCTWTTGVNVDMISGNSRELTIKGASDCTLDGNGIPTACGTNIANFYLNYKGKEDKAFRLAHLKVTGTSGVRIDGDGKSWRLDHIFWDTVTGYTSNRIIWIGRGTAGWITYGLMDHNYFYYSGATSSIVVHYQPSADGGNLDWMGSLGLGTADAFYLENNKFYCGSGIFSLTDSNGPGKFVFRYNDVHNGATMAHDAIVGGYRGARKWEIYNNNFVYDASGNCFVHAGRSGTGVFFNNVISDPYDVLCSSYISFIIYRVSQHTGGDPWDVWCSNASGKAILNSSTNYPQECTSGDGCIDIDGAGSNPSGYPCRDQLGFEGNNPQTSRPFLLWNNTKNGGPITVGAEANYIVAGRDYCISATTMPATCNGVTTTYTPYTYPHPLTFSEQQEIIPPERRIDWSPGIPGGIPNRTIICATIDAGTYGNGITDATAAIQAAINSCPNNQVVYIPAGTYRISNSGLNINKSIVLRGAGSLKTIFQSTPIDTIKMGSFSNTASTYIDVVSGYSKSSTNLTLSNASSVNVGEYYVITQENDYAIVNNSGVSTECTWCTVYRCSSNHNIAWPGWSHGASCDGGNGVIEGGKRAIGQMLKITAKNENTVSFEQGLNWPYYSASLEPKILKITSMVEYAGIEDLKIMFNTTDVADPGIAVYINGCAYCWVKNAEFQGAPRVNIRSLRAYRNEYRDNYIHDTYSMFSEPNHGYGILLMLYSTSNLVENNILNNLESQLVVEGGATGNVIAYNYVKDKSYYGPNWLMHSLGSHAVHPAMNLFEGNYGQGGISADNFHGSASHHTYFRNRILGYQEKAADGTLVNSGIWSVILDQHNYYMNFIGNVLGVNGIHTIYEQEGVDSSNYVKTIYRLGYSSPGDSKAAGNDPNVKATILRHGNFDYVTNSVIWNSNITNHNLPASLYLTSKPSWFGNTPWPPIGPDVPGYANKIPAQLRFEAMNSSCIHKSEIPPCDGCVSGQELIAFINRWKIDNLDVDLKQLIEAIDFWKKSCP